MTEGSYPKGSRPALSVVLADDSLLFRTGLAGLLTDAGLDVLAQASDVGSAFAAVERHRPSVVILDVRMPPTHTDEGIRAAIELRDRYSELGVLVLSTYAQSEWVSQLLSGGADRLGYLLKDRVDDLGTLVEALHRVAGGGTAIDPDVISRLFKAQTRSGGLDALTEREREVLALMAEGLSNGGIARRMFLAPKTIEAHIASIFNALRLEADTDANRRVRAVLTFLRSDTSAQ